MSRYDPLQRHLRSLGQDRWRASFAEIEGLIGSTLPPSARRYQAWWGNHLRSGSQSAAWPEAGYRTAELDLAEQAVTFVRSDTARGGADRPRERRTVRPREGVRLQAATWERLDQRVDDLAARFPEWHAAFLRADPFTGPSRYFHLQTIARLRQHVHLDSALRDLQYLECLYATLGTWGLHRMGPGKAKLTEFQRFCRSVAMLGTQVGDLSGLSLLRVEAPQADEIGARLGQLVASHTGLTQAADCLVANAKALHHLLPDLAPPVDRAYTLRFFFQRQSSPLAIQDTYALIFSRLAGVARRRADYIAGAVAEASPLHAWDSGHAKVVDSALVGWVLSRRAEKPAAR